jgi:hypothetical protein
MSQEEQAVKCCSRQNYIHQQQWHQQYQKQQQQQQAPLALLCIPTAE